MTKEVNLFEKRTESICNLPYSIECRLKFRYLMCFSSSWILLFISLNVQNNTNLRFFSIMARKYGTFCITTNCLSKLVNKKRCLICQIDDKIQKSTFSNRTSASSSMRYQFKWQHSAFFVHAHHSYFSIFICSRGRTTKCTLSFVFITLSKTCDAVAAYPHANMT